MDQAHEPPRIVLEPPKGWFRLDVVELWRNRELVWLLASRDVRVRYKQAVLGVAWAVIQPLLFMAIFTILFGHVAKVPVPGGIPYAPWALAGLVPWMLFAAGAVGASESLVGNANLVSKVYFSRLVIPVSAAASFVPDFFISSVVLVVVMLLFGVVPSIGMLLLPVVCVAALVATLSVGVWLSALNVAYRDVRYAVPFIVQLLLFITPVAYPATSIPQHLRWLAGLNPMAWVLDLARWSMLGTPVAIRVDLLSFVVMIVLLATGLIYFDRVERFFADVI